MFGVSFLKFVSWVFSVEISSYGFNWSVIELSYQDGIWSSYTGFEYDVKFLKFSFLCIIVILTNINLYLMSVSTKFPLADACA